MIDSIHRAFPIIHGLAFAGFLIALILCAARHERAAARVFPAALFALAANLILIVAAARRPPLYGLFEAITPIVLVAGMVYYIEAAAHRQTNLPATALMVGSGVMAFACGLVFTGPVALNHDFFMYANPWVRSFFFFRLVSAGIILGAGIYFAAALKKGMEPLSSGNFISRQNLLFLLGMLFFLISEFSGSFWCLKGWGDSWRWSGNFFQSTAIFFLFMLNFHIPPGEIGRIRSRSFLGAASCVAIIFLFLY